MTLNRVKLGRAVTFMKYLASVFFLIFLPKILIRLSSSLNLVELVVNELTKNISKKITNIFLFLPDLSLFIVKISRAYN